MPWLSGLGLILFFTVFVGAIGWVFRRSGRDVYASMAELPFSDENGGNKI